MRVMGAQSPALILILEPPAAGFALRLRVTFLEALVSYLVLFLFSPPQG